MTLTVDAASLVSTKSNCQAFACLALANQNQAMELVEIRRQRLKLWFSDKPIPEKEKSYISQLINGQASFGEKAARRLERDYAMGPLWLDDRAGVVDKSADANVRVPKQFTSVPVISWVQAGNFQDIEIHLHPGEGDRWEAPREKKLGPRSFALLVEGDSMDDGTDAGIPEGHIIFVDPDLAPFPNAYVIAKDVETQRATFKKLTTDAGRWYLMPLNKQYDKIPIDKPELRVIGIVTEAQAPARRLHD